MADIEELKRMKDACGNYFIQEFMDLDNGKNMALKERVLKELIAGKKPPEINGYNDVMDKEVEPVSLKDIKF